MPRVTKARKISRTPPVIISKAIEVAGQAGQDRPRDMPVDGPARLDPQEIEPITNLAGWMTKAEELAFMEEMVEVIVAESPDKNAEPIVETWVNGRSQFFPRGQRVTCRRKYVERLARTRLTTYSQEYYTDGNGNRAIRNIPRSAIKYPFSILRDDNPRGRPWLEKVLAEG